MLLVLLPSLLSSFSDRILDVFFFFSSRLRQSDPHSQLESVFTDGTLLSLA